MSIPLHTFRYHPTRPLPCQIGRIEDLPPAARAGYPNRHTFYELFWMTAGSGSHTIDFVPYQIQSNTLYFIAPGQIHYWQISTPLRGFALLLAPEFFYTAPGASMLDDLSIFRPEETSPALSVDAPDVTAIDELIHTIFCEFSGAEQGQLTMLQALVQVLLIRAQRLIQCNQPTSRSSAATRLTRQFLRLVEEQYGEQHAVTPYAAQLGVTPGHLTDTLRLTLGRSAGAVIRARCMLEAQRLLAHSDAPISAIALQLHFSDAAYFARAFHRATGHTPQAFRSAFRNLARSYHTAANQS